MTCAKKGLYDITMYDFVMIKNIIILYIKKRLFFYVTETFLIKTTTSP